MEGLTRSAKSKENPTTDFRRQLEISCQHTIKSERAYHRWGIDKDFKLCNADM